MKKFNRRIGDNPFIVEIGEIEGIDINTAEDFLIADAVFNHCMAGGVYANLTFVSSYAITLPTTLSAA